MCQTNSWKSIESSKSSEIITARRSDDVLFKFHFAQFTSVSNFLKILKEYKDCKCSHEAPCTKHQTMEKFNDN